jgi:hypothetical protein
MSLSDEVYRRLYGFVLDESSVADKVNTFRTVLSEAWSEMKVSLSFLRFRVTAILVVAKSALVWWNFTASTSVSTA